jgi:hypothetical protein
MNDHHQTAACGPPRRGALLLLVLSMLTLFMMIGTLMLVLAIRARSTARAFADAVAGPGIQASEARGLLDEALMVLLRGKAAAEAGEDSAMPLESLLADRYGDETLTGEIQAITATGPVLRAQITLDDPPEPQELHGRILTIIPEESDPAPISSFRILSVTGNVAELANLRTVEVRPLPTVFPCDVVINGREFADTAISESGDTFDDRTPFLTQASAETSAGEVTIQRPAYGEAGEALEVDNDGDGFLDGIWPDDVLPPPASGAEARVSYLVLDLGGRFNVNAHGSRAENPGVGPAGVDGSGVFPANSTAWDDLLSGVTIQLGGPPPDERHPVTNGRRYPPFLGGRLDGRFGGMQADADPYDIRLDFDGPRFASRRSAIANVFTCGELEPVLRPYDGDTRTLPPRLTAMLGEDAEAVRMLLTTDGWNTCGVVGSLPETVARAANFDDLPDDVKEGLRFDLDHPDRSLDDPDAKQRLFEGLVATLTAAGVGNQKVKQWAANVIDFADADTTSDEFADAEGGKIQGVEPSSIRKNEQPVFTGWDRGRFESVGELLGVPAGSKAELEAALADGPPPPPPAALDSLRSLAAEHPEILDMVTVGSPFRTTVFLDAGGRRLCRWREPGRINVNTCDERIWNAVTGRDDIDNPFSSPSRARTLSEVLMGVPEVFTQPAGHLPDNDSRFLDRELASRLGNIATTNSDVFAVWITLKLKQSENDPPEYHRLFAIVDRSIPVGYDPGQNLNVRDTLRVLRYLE